MSKVKENPDKELLQEIKDAIAANDGYCCCAIEHTPEMKCPCADFRQMVKNDIAGECSCGRYVIEKEI